MDAKEKLKKAIEKMDIENKQAFLDDLENIEILDIKYYSLSDVVDRGFVWGETEMKLDWIDVFAILYGKL